MRDGAEAFFAVIDENAPAMLLIRWPVSRFRKAGRVFRSVLRPSVVLPPEEKRPACLFCLQELLRFHVPRSYRIFLSPFC